MVVYALQIKAAEVENVATLGRSEEGFEYCFDVQATGSNDIKEGVYINPANNEEIEGSRGTCNFAVKFKGAKKQATVNVVEESTVEVSHQWITFAKFECRNIELVKFRPQPTGLVVKSSGDKPCSFTEVDLVEGFADYDEANQLSVSIDEVEFRIEKTK